MTQFIIRRFLMMIPIMMLAGVICFLLIHLVPGSPAEIMLGPEADSAAIAALTRKMGYDQPIYIQLLKWFSMVLRGDFGVSIYSQKPVLSIIARRAEPSTIIAFGATLLYTIFGITVGLISAVKRNHWLDQVTMTLSLVFASVPSFWLGLNFMLVFSAILGWLPSSGFPGVLNTGELGNLRYLILPCLTIAIPSGGLIEKSYAREVFESMLDDQLAEEAAKKSSFGLSHMLYRHLARQVRNLYKPASQENTGEAASK